MLCFIFRTGFTNSYHKDETGSNSSFFDDGANYGDQYVKKSHADNYEDLNAHKRLGAHYNDAHHQDDRIKHGEYNNGGAYQKDLGEKNHYNRLEIAVTSANLQI